MICKTTFRHSCRLLLLLSSIAALSYAAGYKIRPWTPRAIDTYPAKLTSEGITIAVDPLFTDALAAKVFDRKDMLARGVMPLGVIIFNSNDFPIEVEGPTVELIHDRNRLRSLEPLYAVRCLYDIQTARKVIIPVPLPIPTITIKQCNADACRDFNQKFLAIKRVEPHATAWGFLFMAVSNIADLRKSLESAFVYIRNIYNGKSGTNMMFFEIDLRPAIVAVPRK
jgi:hypothetical protein